MTDPLVPFKTSGTVILDGSGNGTVRLAPTGTDWYIDRIAVKVSPKAVLEAKAYIYEGQIADQYLITNTLIGSTGDTSSGDNIILTDGTPLYVVWSGGDVGSTASVYIAGRQRVPNRGFRGSFG